MSYTLTQPIVVLENMLQYFAVCAKDNLNNYYVDAEPKSPQQIPFRLMKFKSGSTTRQVVVVPGEVERYRTP